MNKRITLFLIAIALLAVFVLVGCQSNTSTSSSQAESSDASTTSQALEEDANVVTLQFPAGEGTTDREKTLASLKQVDGTRGLFMMTYYGDYSTIIEKTNNDLIQKLSKSTPLGCTLLSLTGDKDHPVYGRNIDSTPGFGALLTLYRPENKYASIAFSLTGDVGLTIDSTVDNLDDKQKDAVMASAFYVPCGMNEKGLAVGLAYNPPGESTNDLEGKQVFVTDWIREILDNAQSVDEAVDICKGLRPFDLDANTNAEHILIADAQGNSIIAELSGGQWQFFKEEDKPYQVVTNFPLYNSSEADRENAGCWRYNTANSMLNEIQGKGTWKDTLNVLKAVKQNGGDWTTIWSYAADLSTQTMYFSMFGDYSTIYKVSFK